MINQIASYQWQISNNRARIQNLSAEVNKYAKLYDSLRAFQRTVQNSQSNFNSINDSKKGMLWRINAVKKNNKAASRYYEGLNNILNGIGTKIVAAAYAGLLIHIANLLAEYSSKIARNNSEIRNCKNNINNYKYKINEARRLEREAKNNG